MIEHISHGGEPIPGSGAGESALRGPRLTRIEIGDSPDSWRAAGFDVDDDDTCMIGDVSVRCAGKGEPGQRGFRSWSFAGITREVDGIENLKVLRVDPHDEVNPDGRSAATANPNGIVSMDHVVVRTGNCPRTIAEFELAGFPRRGGRTMTRYGSPLAQSFFWAGDVIIELVGPDHGEPTTDEPTSLFGLALVSSDLARTGEILGDLLSDPRPAVQPGRMIAALRHETVGMSLPIAVMSPHIQR